MIKMTDISKINTRPRQSRVLAKTVTAYLKTPLDFSAMLVFKTGMFVIPKVRY